MKLEDQVVKNLIEMHTIVESKKEALILLDFLKNDEELLKEALILFDDYKMYKFFGKHGYISEQIYIDVITCKKNTGDDFLISELFNILRNPSNFVIKKAIELSSADCYHYWKGKYKKALSPEIIKYASQSKFDSIIISDIPNFKITKSIYIEMIKGYGMSIGYFKTKEKCRSSKFPVFDKDVQNAILNSPEFLQQCPYSGNSPDEMIDELFHELPKEYFYDKMTPWFLSKIYDFSIDEDNKSLIKNHPNYKNPAQLVLESLKKGRK